MKSRQKSPQSGSFINLVRRERVGEMRNALLVISGLLLFAASASAQGSPSYPNFDFQKPLYTVVDVASKPWFSGWSGDCNSGRAPSSLQLWRIDPATLQTVNVPVTVSTGARPDAAAWLAAVCGRPFDNNVGWSLTPKDPEPAGEYLYVVFVTDAPTSWTCGVYPAGFPNAGQQWCDYVANEVYRTVK